MKRRSAPGTPSPSGPGAPAAHPPPRFPTFERASPSVEFALELPATADFAEGGLGRQCAVLCKAGCCRYYSLPIATPRTDREMDDVRWYLMHGGTHVYKHGGDWHLLVLNECKNLLPNNLCGVYETRPAICSEYDATDCEYTGTISYELYFEDEHQFEAWLAERKTKRRDAAARGSRTRAAVAKKARRA